MKKTTVKKVEPKKTTKKVAKKPASTGSKMAKVVNRKPKTK